MQNWINNISTVYFLYSFSFSNRLTCRTECVASVGILTPMSWMTCRSVAQQVNQSVFSPFLLGVVSLQWHQHFTCDTQTKNKTLFLVVSSPMAFGNSWKAATPPCTDVTTEIFPCERNSYCSAWAQRRCMILKGGTFKDCHLKVCSSHCTQVACACLKITTF